MPPNKSKPAAAAKAAVQTSPAKARRLSGAALKASEAKAAKAATLASPTHEQVVLSRDFESDQDGPRVFRAGAHHLPKHLAAEARAKGLVAPPEAE
jgi:hypothetical protein